MKMRWAAVLVVAACAKGSGTGAGTGTGVGTGGTGSGSAPPIVLPPAIDAAPMVDASNAAVDTSAVAPDWWKQGIKACPAGGRLDGAAPPQGTHLRCQRADYIDEGPEAFWDDKGHLVSIGANKDGRRQGLFTAFFPDGKKQREGSYRAGNQHGTWTTWWPDGKVFLVERYVDGRADGEQVATADDGHELARWSLKMGTGTMKWWNSDGTLESETEYVDGRAHGKSTSYFPSGKVQEKSSYVEGQPDGLEQDFYENGQLREQGTYARGTQVGDWSDYDDHGAQTKLVRRDGKGDELFEILYEGGAPLVPIPGASRCDGNDALLRLAGRTPTPGRDEPECVERPRHFPGLAVVGSFAYDAGCMSPEWIVDCATSKEPDAEHVLARAGWARAKGARREELALAYVEEILEMWDGSLMDQPDPRKSVAAADGSVTVTAWTAPRSGMRPDPTITLVQWTFAPSGAVTTKTLKTGKRSF